MALFIITIAGCVNGNSGASGNALMHGFNSGSGASASTAQAPVQMATVLSANSGAEATFNGSTIPLSKGMSIPEDAVVHSGKKGKTTIQFANGSTVSIPARAELDLAEVAPEQAAPAQTSSYSQQISRKISERFSSRNSMSAKRTSATGTIGVRGLQAN